MKLKEYLETKDACKNALEWVEERTVEEMVSDCHRGDWLMWIAYALEIDERKIILTNGHIANTVRDLMDDKRSRDMVDMAIKYGEGKATKEKLEAAAYAASASAYAAYAASSACASSSACAAAYAADAAACADSSACAAAYAADAAAYAAADSASFAKTADIAREFLGAEIIEKLNEKLK